MPINEEHDRREQKMHEDCMPSRPYSHIFIVHFFYDHLTLTDKLSRNDGSIAEDAYLHG